MEKYIFYDVDTQKKYGEAIGLDVAIAFLSGLFAGNIGENLQIQKIQED